MKNLAKIFVAVVALFAYSCVTDTTGDLGVELGGGQTTEVTISLEESRTQLGEKAGNLYPLYWSEGDKISVNGVESAEAVINASNPSVATFTVNGTLAAPYCIAYPAAPAGKVIFAENQTHVGNSTFGSGVSTMYAYGESTGVQLNHLTGVLKIGVVGNATLTYAQISTVDRAPIAGTFDFDFEKGEAKATSTSKNVINYNIPITADAEGLALSNEPQYLHVAVPAGVYDELYVTLYDNQGGVMYATAKADEAKPLSAGKVREFTNPITYVPNSSAFVVKDVASLQAFAAEAATLDKDVLFVADVDLTGEAWTPIEGYKGTVIGNGYAVKGLTAPLFGTISANIKGLHVEDVNIVSNNRAIIGALVCQLVATTTEKLVISNCSASGKLEINNPDFQPEAEPASTYRVINCGGVIGMGEGVEVNSCVNKVNVTVKQLASLASTVGLNPSVGGVIGRTDAATLADASTVTCTITDCVNYGEVKYEDNVETFIYRPFIGGVVGTCAETSTTIVTDCTNYGEVSMNALTYGAKGANAALGISGVIGGSWAAQAYRCNNHAAITADGTFKSIAIGGVLGFSSAIILEDSHNFGPITIKESAKFIGVMAGGLAGAIYDPDGTGHTDNCTNNAPVKILGSTMENPTAGYFYYRVGGLTSFCRHAMTNCTNNAGGDVLTSGNLVNVANGASERNIQVAGCVAYKTKGKIENVDNYGDVTVNNVITNLSTTTSVIEGQPVSFAGVCADSSYSLSGCDNHGNVTFGGSFTGYQFYLAGVYANGVSSNVGVGANSTNSGNVTFATGASAILTGKFFVGGCNAATERGGVANCSNSGKITVDGVAETGGIRIGGVAGYFTGAHTNLTNDGEVYIGKNAVFTGEANIGGVAGYIYSRTINISDYVNNGKVTFEGTHNSTVMVCGNMGKLTSANTTNITNNAAIKYDGNCLGGRIYVSGCLGYHGDSTMILDNIQNNAPISVSGTYTSTSAAYVAGTVAYSNGAGPHNKVYNNADGDINVNFTSCAAAVVVAGVAYKFQDVTNDLKNEGDIVVDGNINNSLYVSGVIGVSNGYNRTDHINKGNVTVNAKVTGHCVISGIIPHGGYEKTFNNCHNEGDFTITEQAEIGKNIYIGGMIGYRSDDDMTLNFTNCSNSGNFTVKCKCAYSEEPAGEKDYNQIYGVWLGGYVGQVRNVKLQPKMTGSNKNTGTIDFAGETNKMVYIGGFVGDNDVATTEYWSGEILNTGDILCSGTVGGGYLGGIIGHTTFPLEGTRAYCKVSGKGLTGIGLITGASRSEAVVTKSHCGGMATGSIINADGDQVVSDVEVTAENYFKYIYGQEVDADTAATDLCGYISSISATPVDATGAEIVVE